MSLVNDALRRAKDAQQKGSPSAPAPKLQPVPAPAEQKRGMGILPIIVAVFAFTGFTMLWKNVHQTTARQVLAETRPTPPAASAPAAKPPVESVPASTPNLPIEKTAPTPAPVAAVSTTAPAPPLKLQAIFFAPGRSTAIISGKTVRVGNTFRGYHIAAITETNATLVSAMETNVMTLEQ